jgi:hypothetical protein
MWAVICTFMSPEQLMEVYESEAEAKAAIPRLAFDHITEDWFEIIEYVPASGATI